LDYVKIPRYPKSSLEVVVSRLKFSTCTRTVTTPTFFAPPEMNCASRQMLLPIVIVFSMPCPASSERGTVAHGPNGS
jgi:hypothetical protein